MSVMSHTSEAARLLRLRRKAKGWSQEYLAAEVSKRAEKTYGGTVTRWEKNGITPRLGAILALDELLGLRPKLWLTPAKGAEGAKS